MGKREGKPKSRKRGKKDKFVRDGFSLVASSLRGLVSIAENFQARLDILQWQVDRLQKRRERGR